MVDIFSIRSSNLKLQLMGYLTVVFRLKTSKTSSRNYLRWVSDGKEKTLTPTLVAIKTYWQSWKRRFSSHQNQT